MKRFIGLALTAALALSLAGCGGAKARLEETASDDSIVSAPGSIVVGDNTEETTSKPDSLTGSKTEDLSQSASLPTQTASVPPDIAFGGYHAGILCNDGTLWMIGSNDKGQIGDGTTSKAKEPVRIMDNVTKVSCGASFSAAIKSDGSLWMWGANESGQIGNGTTENALTPVMIMEDVAFVSTTGVTYTAAIKRDGSLWTWGCVNGGMLGNGTKAGSSTPVKIMDDVAFVYAGGGNAMVIKTDGSLWMWGLNTTGQMGNGEKSNTWIVDPVFVMDDVRSADSDSFGGAFAVIKSDGSLWMWGFLDRIFGDGSGSPFVPTKIMDNVEYFDFSDTGHNAIAIKEDGSLWIWGQGDKGQLGNESKAPSTDPLKVMDNVVSAEMAFHFAIVQKSDGSLWGWGLNVSDVPIQLLTEVTVARCLDRNVLAFKADGSLWGKMGHHEGMLELSKIMG